MASKIVITPAPKSNLKRLSFLPRFALTVDLAGKRVKLLHAPILETLANVSRSAGRGLIQVAQLQFAEIERPARDAATPGRKARKTPAKRASRRKRSK